MLVLKYKHNNNISQEWGISGGKMTKRKKTIVAAFAILGIAVVGLAAGVYAKYIASLESKSASASVAKWAFKKDNESSTLSCPLDKTYDPSTLSADMIAPGTKGTCEIELSNKNSDVAVAYTITLTELAGPKNVTFEYDGATIAKNGTITGTLKPGEELTGDNAIKIDWNWAYYTSPADDDADTKDGLTAAGNSTEGKATMDVTFSISGYQVQPN